MARSVRALNVPQSQPSLPPAQSSHIPQYIDSPLDPERRIKPDNVAFHAVSESAAGLVLRRDWHNCLGAYSLKHPQTLTFPPFLFPILSFSSSSPLSKIFGVAKTSRLRPYRNENRSSFSMLLSLYQPDEVQIGTEPPYDLTDSADKPFNIVDSLVDDEISVADAVFRLANPIDELVKTGFNTEANDGVYFLQQTFSALIPQIPHDHPGAAKLADVVSALMTRSSPLTPEAIEKQQEQYRALGQDVVLGLQSPWQGMVAPECRYSDVAASEYIKYDSRDGKDDYNPQFEHVPRTLRAGSKEASEAVKNEWTRYHAFLARLVMNPNLPHRNLYSGRAFQALVPALEDIQDSNDLLSADVPAAAVWLVYAGDVLFKTKISAQDMGQLGQKGGVLWQNKEEEGGYSKTRWYFWKNRFKWIEKESGADYMAKKLSAKAVWKMENIEKALV